MPKILVVDDNEQLSSMLKDVLESWGYTALTATEGRSCLEIVQRAETGWAHPFHRGDHDDGAGGYGKPYPRLQSRSR